MMRFLCFFAALIALLASFALSLGCVEDSSQSLGIAVSVESDCELVLESVELVFGDHTEYCGSVAKGGGYAVGGIGYPVLLENVVIQFEMEGREERFDVPLKRLAPAGLEGEYEVAFRVNCVDSLDVEASFWRHEHINGTFARVRID